MSGEIITDEIISKLYRTEVFRNTLMIGGAILLFIGLCWALIAQCENYTTMKWDHVDNDISYLTQFAKEADITNKQDIKVFFQKVESFNTFKGFYSYKKPAILIIIGILLLIFGLYIQDKKTSYAKLIPLIKYDTSIYISSLIMKNANINKIVGGNTK